MGFRKGAYAKIWQVKPVTNTLTDVRLSISKKNKNTGEYEQEFGGYVRFAGFDAAKKAALLQEGDRIQLGDVDVTNKYDKEKNVTYTNFTVFNFEIEEVNQAASPSPAPAVDDGEVDDGRLPF